MKDEKKKKPFYKKWWFVLIVLVIIIGAIGSTGGDGDNNESDSKQVAINNSEKEEINNAIQENPSTEKEEANTKKDEPKKEDKSIKAGTYKIGNDIAAGEYMLIADSGFAYFEIASDSKGDIESIIANDNFTTNRYVTVNDGEYLKLQGCKGLVIADATPIIPTDNKYSDGMYKVGVDISAGEYKIIVDENSMMGFGYYEVTTDSRHDLNSIVSNDNFENSTYITINDGQYLKLQEAYIEIN